LKILEVKDTRINAFETHYELSAEVLINFMSRSPALTTLKIDAVGLESILYRGASEQEELRLFEYLETRGIQYIGPRHVTKACGASFNVKKGRFVNRCGWVGRN
jgi:hypothetical protein